MDVRIFVTGESNEARLAGFARRFQRLVRAVGGEEAVRIIKPNRLVELEQVHVVRLETLKRFIDLFGGFLPGSAIELSHHESLLPIAILEGFTHTNLAFAVVVVPGIVQEIETAVERLLD